MGRARRHPVAAGACLTFVAALGAACAFPRPPEAPGPPSPEVEFVARQEILTPLPLRVRLPARYGAEHVLVFFHTWGSRDWGLVELDRKGQTWSGEVSCREVSTVTGDTGYFFVALDASGRAVVGSGSPDWPHVATIVGALPGGAEALEGDAPPLRCHDPADCPPDFPGCPPYAFLRPPCEADADCAHDGRCAWDHHCDVPEILPEDAGSDQERLARAVRKATARYETAAR